MANPTEPLGWQGKAVKNVDGRTGTIASEWTGFLHNALTIMVDGDTEVGAVIDTPQSTVKLSEPQKLLIQSLRDGAKLHHHLDTGLFRLRGRFTTRSVHPSTVQSLLKMGMLNKTLTGDCSLV